MARQLDYLELTTRPDCRKAARTALSLLPIKYIKGGENPLSMSFMS